MPLTEERIGSGCELHTRVSLSAKPLIELMEGHRDEVLKSLVFLLRQRNECGLVLHIQTVQQPLLSQVRSTQKGSYKDRSLSPQELRKCRTPQDAIHPHQLTHEQLQAFRRYRLFKHRPYGRRG